MRRNLTYLVAVAAMLSVATGWSFLQEAATGISVTQSAKAFVATLSADQKATVVLPAGSPLRVDWHFIPKAQRKGQGRHPAHRFAGARTVSVPHPQLRAGDPCPACHEGRLYPLAPALILRLIGQAPLAATRFELARLRCAGCGAVFTASAASTPMKPSWPWNGPAWQRRITSSPSAAIRKRRSSDDTAFQPTASPSSTTAYRLTDCRSGGGG